MKKHKGLIIIGSVILFFIAVVLVYYFPLQRILCEKKFYKYIAAQGVDADDIESIEYHKDYTQDGYFARVRYKSDPGIRYDYLYHLKNGKKYNTMECEVYDENNVFITQKSGIPVKYPPLGWGAED